MSSVTFLFVFVTILTIVFLLLNFILAPHNPKNCIGKSINWGKLPNSGEPLKLLVLSHIWKCMSGWINYSGIVTSQKMSENKMGNRGSKSVIHDTKQSCIIVKEQRVDGSCNAGKSALLKCTLVDFKRSYQIKIPSNPIILTRNFSTLVGELASLEQSSLPPKLDPSYVTGFTDGEGSFILTIIKDNKYKLGWRVACRFVISLHKKDLVLLNSLKNFFNTGSVFLMGKGAAQYRVESLTGLSIIINHFDRYPLNTKKQADYMLFKLAYNLIINKSHLTEKGLSELVSLKAVMNNGLKDELKIAYPNITPVLRPEIPLSLNIDPLWLAGFTDAEGCFSVVVFKSKTSKIGEAVKLSFIITQSVRDEFLIKSLIEYLGCGYTSLDGRGAIDFKVSDFSSLKNIIIPFYDKYYIHGNKSLDFKDFSRVVTLMENKKHLTKQGLDEIKKIRNAMNTNR